MLPDDCSSLLSSKKPPRHSRWRRPSQGRNTGNRHVRRPQRDGRYLLKCSKFLGGRFQRAEDRPTVTRSGAHVAPLRYRTRAAGLALSRIGGKLDYSGKEACKLSLHVGHQVMELALDHPSPIPSLGRRGHAARSVDALKLELKPRFASLTSVLAVI
jgi:hypothetical protein